MDTVKQQKESQKIIPGEGKKAEGRNKTGLFLVVSTTWGKSNAKYNLLKCSWHLSMRYSE